MTILFFPHLCSSYKEELKRNALSIFFLVNKRHDLHYKQLLMVLFDLFFMKMLFSPEQIKSFLLKNICRLKNTISLDFREVKLILNTNRLHNQKYINLYTVAQQENKVTIKLC